MNTAAVEVMKDLPDLNIAYGVSDEYRYLRTNISVTNILLTFLSLN